YAVALEYKPEEMVAPRVIAKGRDLIAQEIKELGREHDIPTVENKPLARALYRSVEVEQEIPIELYKAVAEVLAYVYRIRHRN
ncbi:MAG TPA: EscU/YscU/HrcU family type III secretion system export apparatus switch protein, partial [Terriglobia bacterium]|nr:EscU/YscU/HrcU family type III secretion system export apparatus switch protein [Terriglobia bacterium]